MEWSREQLLENVKFLSQMEGVVKDEFRTSTTMARAAAELVIQAQDRNINSELFMKAASLSKETFNDYNLTMIANILNTVMFAAKAIYNSEDPIQENVELKNEERMVSSYLQEDSLMNDRLPDKVESSSTDIYGYQKSLMEHGNTAIAHVWVKEEELDVGETEASTSKIKYDEEKEEHETAKTPKTVKRKTPAKEDRMSYPVYLSETTIVIGRTLRGNGSYKYCAEKNGQIFTLPAFLLKKKLSNEEKMIFSASFKRERTDWKGRLSSVQGQEEMHQ